MASRSYSNKYSENAVYNLVYKLAKKIAVNVDLLEKRIRENVKIVSVNPFGYSTSKLQFMVFQAIEEFNPDVVVCHGSEILDEVMKDDTQYLIDYYDKILRLKNMGIMSIIAKAKTGDQLYNYKASIADVIFDFYILDDGEDRRYVLNLWRRGMRPRRITGREINQCIDEILSSLRSGQVNIL